MWENKKDKKYGVHYTRFIMSWVRMGGKLGIRGQGVDEFYEWLDSLQLDPDDKENILILADNGKMEFEHSCKKFITE